MPPERSVLVKRKADDEPLEILYVDDHELHAESPRKRRHVFRRVPAQASQSSQLASPKASDSDTGPLDRFSDANRSRLGQDVKLGSASTGKPVAEGHGGRVTVDATRQRLVPRRFHMLKERVASSILSLESMRGTKRKPGAAQLVVFEEERSKKLRSDQVPSIREPSNQNAPSTVNTTITAVSSALTPERPRKRPNASPAERLWRQTSWSNLPSRSRSRDTSPIPGANARGQSERRLAASEIASLELALELQAFSMEQTERDRRRAADAEAAAVAKENPQEGNETTGAESDDEYVYDRYVRCGTPPGVSMQDDSSDALAQDAGALGYLVIGADDEAAWTAYIDDWDDDEEEEGEPLEDDEDSNAEDYYTNDYPDEEPAASEEDEAWAGVYLRSASFGSTDSGELELGGGRTGGGSRGGVRHPWQGSDDGDYNLDESFSESDDESG